MSETYGRRDTHHAPQVVHGRCVHHVVHVFVRCAHFCVRLLRPINGRQLAVGTDLLNVGTGEPLPLIVGYIRVGLPPIATERVTEFLPEST